jgi:hypothetical protein
MFMCSVLLVVVLYTFSGRHLLVFNNTSRSPPVQSSSTVAKLAALISNTSSSLTTRLCDNACHCTVAPAATVVLAVVA